MNEHKSGARRTDPRRADDDVAGDRIPENATEPSDVPLAGDRDRPPGGTGEGRGDAAGEHADIAPSGAEAGDANTPAAGTLPDEDVGNDIAPDRRSTAPTS